MAASESPVQLINDENYFKKSTSYKVKDIFTKYMKLMNHPKAIQIDNAVSEMLEFKWKTVGNTVDCGVFVMRHMETWFGVTAEKWDCGFPLDPGQKKATLTGYVRNTR